VEKGKTYMHMNAKDVFIWIIAADKDLYFVEWWNLGFEGNFWVIPNNQGLPCRQVITVGPEHVVDWVEIEPEKDWKQIRQAQAQRMGLQ
jgi:hypothetical protein